MPTLSRQVTELALDHYADRQKLVTGTSLVAQQMWAEVDPRNIVNSWANQLPELTAVVSGAQLGAARPAAGYVDEALDLQDVEPGAVAEPNPAGFSGRASDAQGLLALLMHPVFVTLASISDGLDVVRALFRGRQNLDMMVSTQVADAGRLADQVGITTRKNADGYIRVAVGNTCSRCLVLAGRFYQFNDGFQRHPKCDCSHVPALSDGARFARGPEQMYDRMSHAERTRAGFTLADQRAIAEGADLAQVVNAHRGMYVAGGKKLTTEGTTRRGLYGGYKRDPETGRLVRRPVGEKVPPRLSVDEIFKVARDRDEALLLLDDNAYTIPFAAPTRAEIRRMSERYVDGEISLAEFEAFQARVHRTRGAVPVAPSLPAPNVPGGVGVGGAAQTVAIRPVLEAARTAGAVDRAFAAEFQRITGRKIRFVNFGGSAATAREHAEGLLRGLERFPDAKLDWVSYGRIKSTSTEYAHASGDRISFSNKWASPAGRKAYLESLQSGVAGWDQGVQEFWYQEFKISSFHPRGTGHPTAIAIHEFGHVLDTNTLGKAISVDLDALILARTQQAMRRIPPAGQTPITGADDLIMREISGYATKDRGELVAEAFADVMMNGPAASKLSREIFDLLEAEYRKGGRRVGKAIVSASEPAPRLASLKVAELKALAKQRGVSIPVGAKKADIVRLLDEGAAPGIAERASLAGQPVPDWAGRPAPPMDAGPRAIAQAVRDLEARPGQYVSLAEIRAHPALARLTRAEQDEAISNAIEVRGISLISWDNRKVLTDRDRAAAWPVPSKTMGPLSPRNIDAVRIEFEMAPSAAPIKAIKAVTPKVPPPTIAQPKATALAAATKPATALAQIDELVGQRATVTSPDAFGSRAARAANDKAKVRAATPLDLEADGGRAMRAVVGTENFEAVQAYRSMMHHDIQEYLEGTAKTANRAFMDRTLPRLDGALDASRLVDDVVVYRGTSVSHVFGRADGDLTGRTFTRKGYTSTASDRRLADAYAKLKINKDDPMVMRILVPRGTKGLTLSDGEAELLLERGLTFRVVKDGGLVNGARRIDVEVVPSTAKALDSALDAAVKSKALTAADITALRRVLASGDQAKVHATLDRLSKKYKATGVTRAGDITKMRAEFEVIGGGKGAAGADLLDDMGTSRFAAWLTQRRDELGARGRHDSFTHGRAFSIDAVTKRQGFDAHPTVVSADELDRLIDGGATPMYRGLAADMEADGRSAGFYANEFRNGDAHWSAGVNGSGVYFIESRTAAEVYASRAPDSVLRAVLRPDAKVITRTEVAAMIKEAKQRAAAAGIEWPEFLSDEGVFAAARGYDAMTARARSGLTTVVLNRSAVIVEGPPGRALAKIPIGADVRVVRRGTELTLPSGETVVLSKPLVRALDKAELAQIRQAAIDEARQVIESAAKPLTAVQLRKAGLTKVGTPSKTKTVAFDPKVHEVRGAAPAAGAKVRVVEPGYSMEYRGETVVLRKPVVEIVDSSAMPRMTEKRIRALVEQETPILVEKIRGGMMSESIQVRTYSTGERVVVKKYGGRGSFRDTDAEELGALVMDAVGARPARTVRISGESVAMEYVDGTLGTRIGLGTPDAIVNSEAARRIGLADILMGNADRNGGNWFQLRDGSIVGIDHGRAWAIDLSLLRAGRNRFSAYLVDMPSLASFPKLRASLDLSKSDLAMVRRRLQKLLPLFVERGQQQWFNDTMELLADIQKRASRP